MKKDIVLLLMLSVCIVGIILIAVTTESFQLQIGDLPALAEPVYPGEIREAECFTIEYKNDPLGLFCKQEVNEVG